LQTVDLGDARPLMQALKNRFDPRNILNPGGGPEGCDAPASETTRGRSSTSACIAAFCLPTCPSYLLLGQEMDSPRGRIYLMKAGVQDRVEVSPSFVQHFDTCLGCMACETACPSGVRYAPLIESTRATIEQAHRRSVGERLFGGCCSRSSPTRHDFVCCRFRWPRTDSCASGASSPLFHQAPRPRDARADDVGFTRITRRENAGSRWSSRVAASGSLRGACSVSFRGVNAATARVLSAEGCDVLAPATQGCCGALALHAGRDDEAGHLHGS
jgi:glycolate oxidase iron-sulfur subunit